MSLISTPLSLKKIDDQQNRNIDKTKISQIGVQTSKVSLA